MIHASNETFLKTIQELEEENRVLRARLQCHAKEQASPEAQDSNHSLLSCFFSAVPYMGAVLNYEGYVLKVLGNNFTGIPSEDLVGMHCSSLLGEGASDGFSERLQQARTARQSTIGNHTIVVEGVLHHYESRILFFDEESALCICRDVTLEQYNKQETEELNFLLNMILESLPVHLFVKDISDGMKYIIWNKHFAESLGIPAEKVLGRTDVDFFPNRKDGEKFMEDDRQLVQAGAGSVEFEETYLTVWGEKRIVNTRKVVTPVLFGGKQLLIGVSMDITRLKETERKLEESKRKAVKNDVSKSVFLSNMGHEIRTPVNSIVGFAHLLDEVEDPEERKQYVSVIESNSNLLLKLIDDILDLSKIEAGVMEFTDEAVNLHQLCLDLYMMHRQNVKGEVEFLYKESDPELTFNGDPSRIMQILTNFLTNACKFTEKGEISYGFERMPDHSIYVYVKDSGAGIEEEKLNSVFERFVRLDNKTAGTGLGLAICKMIIERMGGRIGVTSVRGEGSTFYFTIPASLAER